MFFHNRLATSSAKRVVADFNVQQKKGELSSALQRILAAKHAGFFTLGREILKYSRGRGKISGLEYVRYQFYRRDMAEEDKAAFISDKLHWPIVDRCSSIYWRAVTEDKWVCYTLLAAAGIPIPETLAVFDPSLRSYGNTRTLRNAGDIGDFLAASPPLPIFVKPNDQLGSFGACIITGVGEGKALLHDGAALTPAEMISDIFGQDPFLLQKQLRNHEALAALTPYLATLRLVNLVAGDKVETPFAVLKIPGAGNIADNFWRPGNLLADVDPSTGVVRRIVKGTGLDQELVQTGVGLELPFWKEITELNRRVAALIPAVAYNSLDIGMTPEGPVVIEVNSGSSFDLVQVATGKGFLTPQILAFLAQHGWPKKRKA